MYGFWDLQANVKKNFAVKHTININFKASGGGLKSILCKIKSTVFLLIRESEKKIFQFVYFFNSDSFQMSFIEAFKLFL